MEEDSATGPTEISQSIVPETRRLHLVRVLALGLVGSGFVLLGVATAVSASMATNAKARLSQGLALSDTAVLYGGHSYLCLEVASTEGKRAQGLSGRREIGLYDGMLFLYPESKPTVAPFWMKDTYLPLDVIFVGLDGKVSEVQSMLPCEGDDCPLYTSKVPYLFAVEVPAGHAREFGLTPGTEVRLGGGCFPIDRE